MIGWWRFGCHHNFTILIVIVSTWIRRKVLDNADTSIPFFNDGTSYMIPAAKYFLYTSSIYGTVRYQVQRSCSEDR